MKYGAVTLGQMEAAINKLGGMDGFNALLADELLVTRKEAEKPAAILAFKQDVAVEPPMKALDLKAFFKNRSGLYVWDSFISRAKTLLVKAGPKEAAALKSFDLGQAAYDREITAGAPGNYEVELWTIAQMISAQEGGKAGPLLTNGYANIFYVSGFVVSVYWSAVHGEWDVRGWPLGDSQWLAGRRVFFRN